MSTRAHIIKKVSYDEFTGIYHHYDGYPECLGLLLWEHYNSEEQLDKLLALGDMSYAGPIPEDDPELWTSPSSNSGKCKTYKGRGEKFVDARTGKLSDFTTEDFTYVWMDGHYDVYNFGEYLGKLDDVLRTNGII